MKTIELINAKARKPEWSMAEPVNFCLDEGEHIAIVGRRVIAGIQTRSQREGRHEQPAENLKYSFHRTFNYKFGCKFTHISANNVHFYLIILKI